MAGKIRHKARKSDQVTPLEKKNLQIAYEAALEGIVLLENDGTLPIAPGKIALFGAGAHRTIKGGTGSGEVNSRHAVSIMEGLENAGFTITTKSWISEYGKIYEESETEYIRQFRKRLYSFKIKDLINFMSDPFQPPYGQEITKEDLDSSDTDTCIYVVARQAGEGTDRKLKKHDFTLRETEWNNIALCASFYKKMILVINVGGVFDLGCLDQIEGINSVWFFCQQGAMGGQAFADLLTGKKTPSGKLASSWPMRYEDIPYAMEYGSLNGDLENEYYKEDIYVGYRYYDSYQVEPRYPFGYGLSYAKFQIVLKEFRQNELTAELCVNVKNQSELHSGKEILELYVHCPHGRLEKEYQKLIGFEKTKLLIPGENQDIRIKVNLADAASYDDKTDCMLLEKGEYHFYVGNCSREKGNASKHVLVASVTLGEDVVTDSFSSCFDEKEHSDMANDKLNQLDVSEMLDLIVGDGMFGGSYFKAPGSAGATTGKLLEKGIPNICLADGPAGLRLQRRSAILKNGKIKAVDPFMEVVKYIPEGLKRFIMADDKKYPVVYQNATAFPVGTALAQTWNKELLYQVGSAVGEEMEAYGVTFWLAPGMNIHRNPLCGRNFEYYSEDPYVSGMIAAAITKGVQSHRGCYVTLKHFCCNNQEDNRNRTNAVVSERALREIYLRGFEIAVKEAHPGAVMSSYNKVNGIYANNNGRMLTDILRKQWGFDGVIMTDWFATGKGLGSHVEAVKAGHDMLMPGSDSVKKELLHAYKKGVLTETEIRRAAGNVLEAVFSSRIYQGYLKEKK